jgi:hypothetical protein
VILETLALAALAAAQLSAWPGDAAILQSEFKHDLLAAGIVALILVAAWAFQEWDMRRSSSALGWLGPTAMIVVGIAGALLVAVGLLPPDRFWTDRDFVTERWDDRSLAGFWRMDGRSVGRIEPGTSWGSLGIFGLISTPPTPGITGLPSWDLFKHSTSFAKAGWKTRR